MILKKKQSENDVNDLLDLLSDDVDKKKVHIFSCLESTNKTAKEIARHPETEGMNVVSADMQTGGVGCAGRKFYSPDGGIYVSFVFKPGGRQGTVLCLADGQDTEPSPVSLYPPFYTLAAAVITCEAIRKVTGKTPSIKWVNDLILNDKKICGILTETEIDADSGLPNRIVTGIGLNLYMDKEKLPPEIKEKAGALFYEREGLLYKNELTAEIINGMRKLECMSQGDGTASHHR